MIELEYTTALETLQRVEPDHNMLKVLSSGYSPINVLYLQSAMKEVSFLKAEPVTEVVDDTEEQFHIEKRQLYGLRAKLSNKFHLCVTDKQRAEISIAIQRVQADIRDVNVNLRYYRKHGEPMPENTDEKYPVPDDGLELGKKLNSIRASISRYRRKVKELESQNQDDANNAELSNVRAKLDNKLKHLEYVEKAIKDKSVQS